MEKTINLAPKNKCTGCAACSDVCPTDSITFIEEGIHSYPHINVDTCISCGKCMSVCQVLKQEVFKPEIEQKFYCAWNKNATERKASTSGGAGSAMAAGAIALGFYVSGAGFDKHWHLRHVSSKEQSVIDSFRGSKYLKSDTCGSLREVARLIGQGENVLFTGTPCQCDAVERIIPQSKRDNLITCAIICHGVNSPKVWEDYVSYIEKKEKSHLIEYNFRSKSKGWIEVKGGGKLRILKIMSNGKKSDQPSWRNLFHNWFGLHYILREACFRCPYRKEQRMADITIGDFWGISNVLPDLETHEGVSVIITSTKRGEGFINSCEQLHLIPVDGVIAKKGLKGLIERRTEEKTAIDIERSKNFEAEYLKHNFAEMAQLYPAETYLGRVLSSLKSRLHLGKA